MLHDSLSWFVLWVLVGLVVEHAHQTLVHLRIHLVGQVRLVHPLHLGLTHHHLHQQSLVSLLRELHLVVVASTNHLVLVLIHANVVLRLTHEVWLHWHLVLAHANVGVAVAHSVHWVHLLVDVVDECAFVAVFTVALYI